MAVEAGDSHESYRVSPETKWGRADGYCRATIQRARDMSALECRCLVCGQQTIAIHQATMPVGRDRLGEMDVQSASFMQATGLPWIVYRDCRTMKQGVRSMPDPPDAKESPWLTQVCG